MPARGPCFICTDIRVRDLARAVRFYRALGLRPLASGRMADGTRLVWMQDPRTGQLLELFHLSPASPLYTPYRPQSEASSSRIFSVVDADPVLRRLRRLGHREHRAYEDGRVRLTFLRDPDGAVIELVSWAESARAGRGDAPMIGLVTPLRRRIPAVRRTRRPRPRSG